MKKIETVPAHNSPLMFGIRAIDDRAGRLDEFGMIGFAPHGTPAGAPCAPEHLLGRAGIIRRARVDENGQWHHLGWTVAALSVQFGDAGDYRVGVLALDRSDSATAGDLFAAVAAFWTIDREDAAELLADSEATARRRAGGNSVYTHGCHRRGFSGWTSDDDSQLNQVLAAR